MDIPIEIKKQIERECNGDSSFISWAEFGYSLASKALSDANASLLDEMSHSRNALSDASKEIEELKELALDTNKLNEKSIEMLKKEIERLKGLIKEAKTGGCSCSNCEKSYNKFKTENNL